jgi:hypothetical protein
MMMGAMEHDEVRELLEDAAVEPGGLERLMAGDTPTAAVVASHLAGCPDCTDELDRLRRTVALVRPAVRAVPPPELRERTLAYVAALGRERIPAAPAGVATRAAVTPPRVVPLSDPPAPTRRFAAPRLRALAALAAVLIVAVTGTGLLITAGNAGVLRGQAAEIEALGDVARWTLRIDAQPDARRVTLASTNGSTTGTLVFSPSSSELVVVADALARPPAGSEYRCWVEVGGARQPIGKMFFGGDLAYWVGPVAKIRELPSGSRFGVSLVDLASGQPGQTVLEGDG